MTLRTLLEKATGGEWEVEFSEAYNVRASHGGIVAQCFHLKGRHGALGRVDSEEVAANAALIVALHNCAGELLLVVEAAEAVNEIFESVHAGCVVMNRNTCNCHRCKLYCALLAYREKETRL